MSRKRKKEITAGFMKKMVTGILALSLFLCVSCNAQKKDSGNSASGGDKSLSGTWESDFGVTYIFEGNKFTYDMLGTKVTVPYKVKGNAIVTELMGAKTELEYEIKGDTLTVEFMGMPMEFTRVGKKK
jgi:hypothetical protein